MRQAGSEDHQHDDRVTSVSIEVEGRLHPYAINDWLQVAVLRHAPVLVTASMCQPAR